MGDTKPVVSSIHIEKSKRNKVLRCKADTLGVCYFVNAVCDVDIIGKETGWRVGKGGSRDFHPIVWGVVTPRIGNLRKNGFRWRWWDEWERPHERIR